MRCCDCKHCVLEKVEDYGGDPGCYDIWKTCELGHSVYGNTNNCRDFSR